MMKTDKKKKKVMNCDYSLLDLISLVIAANAFKFACLKNVLLEILQHFAANYWL